MTPQLAVQPQAPASRPAAAPWRNVSPERRLHWQPIGQRRVLHPWPARSRAVMRRLRRGQGRLCRGRSLVSWYLDARAGPPGQRTAHGGRSCRDRAQQPDRAAGRGPADRAAGRQGAVHLGLMGGYGSARSTSTSSLALPGGATAQARARGKVSGYSAGVYGTYYQDDASRMGAYADGWLQYGRFNNRIDSELGRRAMTPRCGAPRPKPAMRSSLSPSARRWGRSLSSRTSSWSTATTMRRMPCCRGPAWAKATRRLGRACRRAHVSRGHCGRAGGASVHGTGLAAPLQYAVRADGAQHAGRRVLARPPGIDPGAEGRISHRLLVAGHVFGYEGRGGQHGYGGMVDAGYRW